jgi:hypothetical protein
VAAALMAFRRAIVLLVKEGALPPMGGEINDFLI